MKCKCNMITNIHLMHVIIFFSFLKELSEESEVKDGDEKEKGHKWH